MAGEDNLVSFRDMTAERQREIASAGGKASQKAARKRKAMREQAELLLSLPFKDRKIKDASGKEVSLLKELKKISGIDGDLDNQMAMIISLWQNALNGGKNSVQAFNSLRDLLGEKPKEVVEIHSTDATVKELEELIKSKREKDE